jgi:hypothetical protein
MMTAEEFQHIANASRTGYLKYWKAQSIIGTIKTIPQILEDQDRLKKYLTNCLEMECFGETDITNIMNAIKKGE